MPNCARHVGAGGKLAERASIAGDREKAAGLFRALSTAPNCGEAKAILEAEGFAVDYVEEHWGRRLAAVRLGGVRLIDNVGGAAIMLLCLDIGNSQIFGGVYDGEDLKATFRYTSSIRASSDEFGTFFRSVLRENAVAPEEIAMAAFVP